MLGAGIKLSKNLLERIRIVASAAGYSSPQEFIEHVLEREVAKLESSDSKEALLEKLKGLGYLE